MSEILEGTDEFNRQHRILNQANLDPYLDQPIPNQQPLNVPRDEQWEHLDGQEYQPSPHIVEDTREGFDQNGDWHTAMGYLSGRQDPNPANMDALSTINMPYRLAHQIQEAIIKEAEQYDYTLGRAEREDIATDMAYRWYNGREVEPPSLALDALYYWRRIYGRGVQGNG